MEGYRGSGRVSGVRGVNVEAPLLIGLPNAREGKL